MGKRKYATIGCSLMYAGSILAADPETYTVQEGDIFTAIVEKYAVESEEYNYGQTLFLFNKVNDHLSNKDNLHPGDVIRVPSELLENVIRAAVVEAPSNHIYVVERGDTLFEIMEAVYPGTDAKDNLAMVLGANPEISDIDLIEVGQKLLFPKRAPAAAATQDTYTFVLENKPDLKKEIMELPRSLSKHYIILFKRLNAAEKKRDFLKELKNLLDFSRVLEHDNLEVVFLKLIDSTMRSPGRKEYIRDLKTFYQLWKDARKKVS